VDRAVKAVLKGLWETAVILLSTLVKVGKLWLEVLKEAMKEEEKRRE